MVHIHIYYDTIQTNIVLVRNRIAIGKSDGYSYLIELTAETEELLQIKIDCFISGYMYGNENENFDGAIFDETENIIFANDDSFDIVFEDVENKEVMNYVDVCQSTNCVDDLLNELNISYGF